MDHPEFTICINSLHFPPKAEDSASWDKMEPESRTVLSSLYNWLRNSMKTAAKPSYVAGRLSGSVFCCCLLDGLAMLLCRADALRRDVDVTGFFIHRNESLRTAWQLARVPLLFMCAGGWDNTGTVFMTPDEINGKAAALMFPPEYQNRLVGMGVEMLSSDIPFSFALSSYPLHSAPLKFTSAHTQNETFQADSSEIVINPETLRVCRMQVAKRFRGIHAMELVRSGRKQFLEVKMRELSDRASAKKDKAVLKEMLSRYPTEDVWYLRLILPNGEYSELLDQYTNNKLCSGAIPFEELFFAMKRAEMNAGSFFSRQADGNGREAAEPKGKDTRKSAAKLSQTAEDPRKNDGGREKPFSRFIKKQQ